MRLMSISPPRANIRVIVNIGAILNISTAVNIRTVVLMEKHKIEELGGRLYASCEKCCFRKR